MSLALDLSNFTPLFSASDAQCWMANGVTRAVVQAVQGGGAYPVGRTPQQLQACAEAALRTDGYVLPFMNDGLGNLRGKKSLTRGYRIGRWWGDFEEPMTVAYMRFVLTEMDTWEADEGPVGFYTGKWFVDGMSPAERAKLLNDPFFTNRPLWIMDNVHPAGSPQLFGGWSTWAMHQRWLDATLCSISGIDISYINPEFENATPAGGDTVIRVGEGMRAQMSNAGDQPLFGHKFYTETDDDNQTYNVEECFGTKGRYVSSNSSGTWVNAGPF